MTTPPIRVPEPYTVQDQLRATIQAIGTPEVLRRAMQDAHALAGVLVENHAGSTGVVYVQQLDHDIHGLQGNGWNLMFSTFSPPGTLARMLEVLLQADRHPPFRHQEPL